MSSIKPVLAQRIEQRLGLVLTPQMRQRIEMLSMTTLELRELVTNELVNNPVLDEALVDEQSENSVTTDELLTQNESEINDLDPPLLEDSFQTSVNDLSPGSSNDVSTIPVETESESETTKDSFEEIDFGNTFNDYLDPGYKTREFEDRETFPFENTASKPASLQEHLLWQLNLIKSSAKVRDAAEAIIFSLDSNGYLADPIQEIADIGGWTTEIVEEARKLIQTLDPIGSGSCNITECFLIQLKQRGDENRLAAKLVRKHFNRLQQYKWPDLAKELGVSIDEIAKEVDLILKLEPYPGRQFSNDKAQSIQPEVYIEKIDDQYYIYFNDDGMPQLHINSYYRNILESSSSSKEEKSYIRDCFRSAVDLLKNIEHRRQTIYKICHAIVEHQKAFLDGGIEYIKPMMLKDLAQSLGIHLSTVSRVVNRKYAHTPVGTIELRRFFTEGMLTEQGEEISTQLIRLQIKKMIEEEDHHHPLTDDEIVQKLADKGIKLARRTVAKYRDQMSILGSRERRVVI